MDLYLFFSTLLILLIKIIFKVNRQLSGSSHLTIKILTLLLLLIKMLYDI